MSEKIDIDLDPKKVLDALHDMSQESKKLADDVEESLGKRAPKSMATMEEAAEKGTNKISGYFRNLGMRVKEDLKTAFDVGKLLSGIKLTDEIAKGTRQVLDMERAFDRLNTRLGLSGRQLNEFKTAMGKKVAATGQTLESVLPGVESAASRGNIKSPDQLASIAETLGQAKGATGEDTAHLSETITDILRNQGKSINAGTFKATMDAIQGTRVAGAFGTAGEAAQAISSVTQGLSPAMMKKLGLGTREAGGLAAAASKSGAGGQDILNHILQMASQPGGTSQLNALFGTQLFKGGKMDVGAFKNINSGRLGQFSEQTLSSATGANQADLARFLETMKGGMSDFEKVTSGANETASQFQTATDNLASKIDRFKENAKEAGREIGESLATLGKDVLNGDFSKLGGDAAGVGKAAMSNKGSLLAALGVTAGAGLLMGSGAKGLLSKIPGLGGVLGGEAAKSAGITPVFVVNWPGGGLGGLGSMGGAGSLLARLGPLALPAAGVAAAGAAGVGAGMLANKGIDAITGGEGLGGKIYDWLHPDQMQPTNPKASGAQLSPETIQKAVRDGTVEAHEKVKKPAVMTNPSGPPNRGGNL